MQTSEEKAIELERYVSETIYILGIPANLSGFHCLHSALMIAVVDKTAINDILEKIYSRISEENKVTKERVPLSIRRAIEASWKRGNSKELKEIFGSSALKDKVPTNAEFIGVLSELIRMRHKAEASQITRR